MKASAPSRGIDVSDVELENLDPYRSRDVSLEGRVSYSIARERTITGPLPERGRSVGLVVVRASDDVKRVRKEWRATIRDSTLFSSKYRLRARDGSYRWHE